MNDYIKITEIIDTILEENQSKFTMNWQKYIYILPSKILFRPTVYTFGRNLKFLFYFPA